MPHAALCVVQRQRQSKPQFLPCCFNAARGFVCGAAEILSNSAPAFKVSMPHAALCVVQR